MKIFAVFCASIAVWLSTLDLSMYRIQTTFSGLQELRNMSSHDIQASLDAYQYLADNSDRTYETDTSHETEQVRRYYTVIQALLSVVDIEKLYIAPQIDERVGLYRNQVLLERQMVGLLNLTSSSRVLDIGCGRGRVARHVAEISGARVDGFNIDARQVENAREQDLGPNSTLDLHFQVGDFQQAFRYADESFDASYDMQALWAFTKKRDLDRVSRELYRTLKRGGRFFSNSYVITHAFDPHDPHHRRLHELYLPTLAASQSNYPRDIVASLERAGFWVERSRPSQSPAWPLTDQKTFMIESLRKVMSALSWVGILPDTWPKLAENLLKGGRAWKEAERAKIADLCWQFLAVKP